MYYTNGKKKNKFYLLILISLIILSAFVISQQREDTGVIRITNLNVSSRNESGKLIYAGGNSNINISLQLRNGISFIDITDGLFYSQIDKRYKFGFNKTYSIVPIQFNINQTIGARYIIDSSNDLELRGWTIRTSSTRTRDGERYEDIDFSDICRPKEVWTWNERSQDYDTTILFNPDCQITKTKDNQVEIVFFTQFNSTTKNLFIDPTININDVSTAPSETINIIKETGFSHLNYTNRNLTMYFPFDVQNKSGVTWDYTDNNVDSTYIGNRTNTILEGGIYGGSVYMPGDAGNPSDTYIVLPSPPSSVNITHYTISAWVKVGYFSGNGAERNEIYHAEVSSGTSEMIRFQVTGAGVLRVDDDYGGLNLCNAVTLNTNQWYFLTTTRNASSLTSYVDGTECIRDVAISVMPGNIAGGHFIGARTLAGVSTLNGSIDNLMIFNYGMNYTEIIALMNSTRPIFNPKGEHRLVNVNVSGDSTENFINVTVNMYNNFTSLINLSVGNQSGIGYVYGAEYSPSGIGYIRNFTNIPIGTPNNISLNFTFYAGNTTLTPFITPNLAYNISIISWTQSTGDTTFPIVNITYPLNITYSSVQRIMNYTVIETNLANCWYSLNGGTTNISVTCGQNVTNLNSGLGSSTWRVYANDTSGNINSSSVTFTVSINQNISFVSPTSSNGTHVNSTSFVSNTTMSGSNISKIIYAFNSTNFTYFDSSLVFHINFNNNSLIGDNATYFIDNSLYSNNATGVSLTSNGININGKYGSGINLSGGPDYIDVGSPVILTNMSELSYEAWIKPMNFTGSQRGLITKGNQKEFYFNDSGALIGLIGCTAVEASEQNSGIPTNQWTHVVMTYSDSGSRNVSIYVNGIKNSTKADGTCEGSILRDDAANPSLRIGSWALSGNFNGSIDEVRIWNRSLTASEVQQSYFSNLQRYDSGKWYLLINQSNSTSSGLQNGTYYYQVSMIDTNYNQTDYRQIILGTSITPSNYINNIINSLLTNGLSSKISSIRRNIVLPISITNILSKISNMIRNNIISITISNKVNDYLGRLRNVVQQAILTPITSKLSSLFRNNNLQLMFYSSVNGIRRVIRETVNSLTLTSITNKFSQLFRLINNQIIINISQIRQKTMIILTSMKIILSNLVDTLLTAFGTQNSVNILQSLTTTNIMSKFSSLTRNLQNHLNMGSIILKSSNFFRSIINSILAFFNVIASIILPTTTTPSGSIGGGGTGINPKIINITLCNYTYDYVNNYGTDYSLIDLKIDEIKKETNLTFEWTETRNYIDNWQSYCSDIINRSLKENLVCSKAKDFINTDYDNKDILNATNSLKDFIIISDKLFDYYIKNYYPICDKKSIIEIKTIEKYKIPAFIIFIILLLLIAYLVQVRRTGTYLLFGYRLGKKESKKQ